MRIAELGGLRWSDIDFSAGIIRVERSLVVVDYPDRKPHRTLEIHEPKTEAGYRTIPILSFVRAALEEEKAWQEESGERCLATVDGYSDLLWFNRFGQPQHQGTVNRAIRRLIRDCNQHIMSNSKEKDPVLIPPFSCHTLRRTCATRLIEEGINPILVQGFMGHASLDTTMEIYVKTTEYFKKKSFGLDAGKEYPNMFHDALKHLKHKNSTAPPHDYAYSLSRTDASRLALAEFTDHLTHFYTNSTQSEVASSNEI